MRALGIGVAVMLAACGSKGPLDGEWSSGSALDSCLTFLTFSEGAYSRTDHCTAQVGSDAPVAVEQTERGEFAVEPTIVTLTPVAFSCPDHYEGPVSGPWRINEYGTLFLLGAPYSPAGVSIPRPIAVRTVAKLAPGCAP